jgi:erythromycin esterase
MTTRLLALQLALCSSVALAADSPTLVNPAFDRADPATGAPAGWTVAGDVKNVRAECESACVLHVHGDEGGAQDAAVVQTIAPGRAAGHRLILSGRIRTDRIDGHAGLVVRVIGQTGEIGVQQGLAAAPDRADEWSQVQVTVPVPANATALIIIAGLRGKGDAWIDRLALKVDDSVTVAAVTPPVAPPRPIPSQRLLDDAALKIADEDMPAMPAAWRADVRARVHPIRSLFSDDFSDLQFLKPLLAGKRIVLLGEAAHGVAESNWAKVRLVKFLHQQLGFDVVAFESSFDQCYDADKSIGKSAPHDVMARCLFPLWHTREVDALFDYMGAVRKTARPLALAGFDVQFTTTVVDKSRLRRMLAIADAALAAPLDDREKEVGVLRPMTAQRSREVEAYYGDIARALGAQRTKLTAAGFDPADIDLEIQAAHARAWLARRNVFLDASHSAQGSEVRDAGMAEQLDYLLDVLYARRKVIVWAHNQHVIHAHEVGEFTSMSELLGRRRRAEMYSVGFYMGHGVVNNGFGPPWAVAPPPAGTVEAVLANAGLKYAFVDFSGAAAGPATAWFTANNTVREFGTNPRELVPAQSFDAMFYIDAVTPAEKY